MFNLSRIPVIVSFKNSKTEEQKETSDSQDLPKIFPTPKKATTNESLASRKTVPCGVSFVPKVSTKVVDSTSSSPRLTSPLICRTPWFLSAEGCGGLMAHGDSGITKREWIYDMNGSIIN
jgi:hypothetical protein